MLFARNKKFNIPNLNNFYSIIILYYLKRITYLSYFEKGENQFAVCY